MTDTWIRMGAWLLYDGWSVMAVWTAAGIWSRRRQPAPLPGLDGLFAGYVLGVWGLFSYVFILCATSTVAQLNTDLGAWGLWVVHYLELLFSATAWVLLYLLRLLWPPHPPKLWHLRLLFCAALTFCHVLMTMPSA